MPTLGCALTLLGPLLSGYPTDPAASEETGIQRLAWQRAIDSGARRGRKLVPGGRRTLKEVRLRLESNPTYDIGPDTPKDEALQRRLVQLLKGRGFKRYGVALLDITDPARPRYAAYREDIQLTPGSTAKLLVAAALLREVARRYPDLDKRRAFLRTRTITADDWAFPSSHEVPVVQGDRVVVRRVRRGDQFSLWEWLDHAISPSSNSAATLLWREAMGLSLSEEVQTFDDAFFRGFDRDVRTKAAFQVVDRPQTEAGLDPGTFYVRTFFSRGASRWIRSSSSRGTPRALVRWMLRVEQGRMVDRFSSLELKRLMYVTRKRIRYAYAPELKSSAIYFKSGSLYGCIPGTRCGKYRGNRVNILNSLTEVEGATSTSTPAYIVGVMSNVLHRNASFDHAVLAGHIHRLVTETR